MNDFDNQGRPRPDDFAMDEPLPPGATEPVDVVQVRADDALIAALSSIGDPDVDDPIDERLTELLQSWRDDVRDAPEFTPIDIGAATAALATAPRPRRRQSPIGPIATAAAVLVIAFVGLGLAAKGAVPGDPLWNVTKVLYSEKARSVEAAATVKTKLDEASRALREGHVSEAKAALQEAQQKLPVIADEDGKTQLATRTEQLMAQASSSPAAPTSTSTEPPPATTSEPTSTSVLDPPVSTSNPADPPTSSVVPSEDPAPTDTSEVPTPPGGEAGSGTSGTGGQTVPSENAGASSSTG